MTPPTPREDHTASKPVPDGKVVLQTTDGEVYTHLFDHDNSWVHEPFGVVFKEQGRRTVFPWTNIVVYDVEYNTPEYDQRMLGWLKDCDHEWLTHPSVGHYCQHCRIDMADLDKLYKDEFDKPPALISTEPSVDRESQRHETAAASGEVPAPASGPVVRIVTMLEDPSEFCACDDESTPHEGKCRMKPSTWPIEIGPDEEGNTQF